MHLFYGMDERAVKEILRKKVDVRARRGYQAKESHIEIQGPEVNKRETKDLENYLYNGNYAKNIELGKRCFLPSSQYLLTAEVVLHLLWSISCSFARLLLSSVFTLFMLFALTQPQLCHVQCPRYYISLTFFPGMCIMQLQNSSLCCRGEQS